MNSLDVSQAVTDARAIRIAIVPVGEISHVKFKDFANMVKCFNTLELRHMNRAHQQLLKPSSSSSSNAGDPFPHLSWSEGRLVFNFVDTEIFISDWEDLQAHRKIFGVIGIVHCQKYSDLSLAIKEFREVTQRYPTSLHAACFGFEPLQDQPDLDVSLTSGGSGGTSTSFIMVPNGDKRHLLFYLNTWLLDFADRLLQALEGMMTQQSEQSAYISTPLDSCRNAEEIARLKKRKPGRVAKCRGDYCLLAGSPTDALEHYTQAIELTKSMGDLEWLGAALEGHCSALVLQLEQQSQPQPQQLHQVQEEVIEKYQEGISHYSKRKALILELEATLKLARFYSTIPSKKLDAAELLMHAYGLGSGLSTQFKILLASAIGLQFKSLGFNRKFAFFLRETAVFYHKIFNDHTAHNLLLMASPYYHFPELLRLLQDSSYEQEERQKTAEGKRVDSWPFLQKAMLKDLVVISKTSGDTHSAIAEITFLLRKLYFATSQQTQLELSNDLSALTANLPPISGIEMIGFPQLLHVAPHRLPEALSPHLFVKPTAERGLFIFNPFDRKKGKKEDVVWVAQEIVSVVALLANPMAFPIHIESISLSVRGVEFEAYPTSLTLPARVNNVQVTLSGKPLTSGDLEICGCTIRCFNITCEHPVSSTGDGILPFNRGTVCTSKTVKATEKLTSVKVLPALPSLQVLLKHNAPNYTLRDGERATQFIHVENTGIQPTAFINLTVTETYSKVPPVMNVNPSELAKTITYDENVLSQHLPLPPGKSFVLPIHFFASMFTTINGAKFTFEYGSANVDDFARKTTISVSLSISEGPNLTGFSVYPASQKLLTEDDHKQQEQKKEKRKEKNGVCILAFEINNPMPENIQVEASSPNKQPSSFTVTSGSQKRVLLEIEQFLVPEETLSGVELPPSQLSPRSRKRVAPLTLDQQQQTRRLHAFKLELMKRLSLRWTSFHEHKRQGEIALHRVDLSWEMMQTLSSQPLEAQLLLQGFESRPPTGKGRGEEEEDGEDGEDGEMMSCVARKHHTLGVTVKNKGEESVWVQTELQIDNMNNHDLSDLILLGTTHSRFQLKAGSSCEHKTMVFFPRGEKSYNMSWRVSEEASGSFSFFKSFVLKVVNL